MNDVVNPLSEPEIAVFMARLETQIRGQIAEELMGRHKDVKHRQIVLLQKLTVPGIWDRTTSTPLIS